MYMVRSRGVMVVMVLALLVVSGSAVSCNPKQADQVTVQLSWFHTVEFAGFYAAVEQGYYEKENLAVKLAPGGFDVLPWDEVTSGKADFGVTGGDSLLIARAEGDPLTAVSALFRRSPVVLMTLAESGIRSPQDMVGKRVGITSPGMDNTNDIQFLAMLNRLGISQSDMELILIENFSTDSLTSGTMDVYSGFSTNEPVEAKMKGIDVNLIFPQDYGVMIYPNVLFTREQMVQEQPGVVERFVKATLMGYQYAIEHPDEAASLALKYDDTLNPEVQQASMRAEIPLLDTGDAPIGTMDQVIWESTHDILLKQGFISLQVDLSRLYTNQFVEKAR